MSRLRNFNGSSLAALSPAAGGGGSPTAYPTVALAADTSLATAAGTALGTNGKVGGFALIGWKKSSPPAALASILMTDAGVQIGCSVFIDSNGYIKIRLSESGPSTILDLVAPINICDGAAHTILASWDLSQSSEAAALSMYVDGSSSLTATGASFPISPNINYAASADIITLFRGFTGPAYFAGAAEVQALWMHAGARPDLTTSGGRNAFLATNIGLNGDGPTTSSPAIFAVGPAADWNSGSGLNRGSIAKFFKAGTSLTDVGTPGTWP